MNFWPIFKKEVSAYFGSSSTHVVFTVFLVLSGFFFITDMALFEKTNIRGTASVVSGLWVNYLNDVRFLMIFFLPLLTMRLFAEEKKLGTIELLTTYPVRDIEILAGKYLACLLVFLVMLLLTFVNVILVGIIWDFSEIVPVLAGYLGLFLLGCSLISCGVFVSSLTDNQIVAAIGTMGLFVLFWFLTWNAMMGSEDLIRVLSRLSLFDRVYDFLEGKINTKDIVFFLLFSCFFLFLTLRSLGSRAWKGLK